MSLIADLLKKVEPRKSSGAEVPPGLKRIVLESSRQQGVGRSRVTTIGLLALGVASCGVAALFVMDYLQKPLPKNKRPVATVAAPVPTVTPAPLAAPVAAPPVPVAVQDVKKQPAAAKSQHPQTQAAETSIAAASAKTPTPQSARIVKSAIKPAKAPLQAFVPSKRSTSDPAQHNQPVEEVNQTTRAGKAMPVTEAAAPRKLSRDDLASRDAYLYSARSSEARGDYRQALEQYRKALAIDHSNHMLLNNSAGVLIRMGATEEATVLLDRCLELKHGYAPALVNKGIIAIKGGNTADGEVWLNKALAVDPGNRHALMSSALIKEKAKDYKGAAAIYRRLTETGDGQGFVGMGRVAESEGNKAEAARIYRAGLGRENLSPEIKRQLSERLGMVER